MMKRFIFVVSGEWALWQEEMIERQRRSLGVAARQRRTTFTQSVGNGGRRRAKALWFTMETPESPQTEANDSFLPSMILSPAQAGSPSVHRTPFSMPSTAGLLSPFKSPMLSHKTSKSSLPPIPGSLPEPKGKEVSNDRSTDLDMDFSDPDPMTRSPQSGGEWVRPVLLSQGHGEETLKDGQLELGMRSIEGSSSSTKI